MATYYKKNEAGEFIEADDAVENDFRQRSDKIIREKLEKAREKYKDEIRTEIDAEVRTNTADAIKSEIRNEIEAEYKTKLDEAQEKAQQLDVALRRKTIAAEYGFKPEAEEFLGTGTDDDMRAKADALKSNFGSSNAVPAMEKSSEPSVSKVQQSTGITVEIQQPKT